MLLQTKVIQISSAMGGYLDCEVKQDEGFSILHVEIEISTLVTHVKTGGSDFIFIFPCMSVAACAHSGANFMPFIIIHVIVLVLSYQTDLQQISKGNFGRKDIKIS